MIRLLVVDDSALMRRLMGQVFRAEGDFEIAFARDGAEALELLPEFRPDVVTLDVQMPRMNGLACLDRIMLERPCPVVMVSSVTEKGAVETLQALELGAVDFVAKPGGAVSLAMDELGPLLVEKVRAAAGARLRRSLRLTERVRLRAGLAAAEPRGPAVPDRSPQQPAQQQAPQQAPQQALPPEAPWPPAAAQAFGIAEKVVLVGCSTGGPPALDALLAPLPASFPWPILVAQHMPAAFTGPLARRLDKLCALEVVEVTQPVPLRPGLVYVGRGDADIILGRRPGGLVVMAAPSLPEHRWHPSVDRLVESAMQHLPPGRLVGVLMTGMGNDGAGAMARLRAGGGRTIAEAEETAVVWGMPGALVHAGGAEAVLPLDAIADRLMGWAP
ncbi:two-component system, chemotaxis family, response regulator CheB [Roseomonas rosea]|uniref:Protein-glutamate methylesterase/protein-glutamine glutaminase n=1 Tax=Muricoccus roseus TaxID=198092 RepID=A0A1M6PF09_9PROT|nr:chemotaxis-specific protein-glutamate methyltransferase CheB [Roseomonas rosea]SHK06538.1 two-component system, chemotaxis family, response regulator CheB [Roseomonas rosea]